MQNYRDKRVLFIAPLPPPIHGSAVVSKQIKDSTIINESFLCDWVNISTSRELNEIGKKTLTKLFRLIWALLCTFRRLLTRRYDLCYLAITCHGNGFLKDAPFVLLCKLFGRRIVIHQHNKGMSRDIGKFPYKWLLPLCYKRTKVILLSWLLYPDIERIVPKENVFICPNGIELINSRIIAKNPFGENQIPRLLFLSNLIESKGVFVLLDALAILSTDGVLFHCDFVGGETKKIDSGRFAKEVDRRGLNSFVTYHGKKFGEDKDSFFDNADIFVFPTYYENETFGLVNLEAMAHSLPIVTTNEGGIPDVVQDGINGIVCESRNPNAISDALRMLIADPSLCRRMGDAGRKRYEELFTEGIFETRMKEVLSLSINSIN